MRSYDNNLAKYAPEGVSRPDMDRRADWAEEDIDSPSYIANKPDSPGGGSGGSEVAIVNVTVTQREQGDGFTCEADKTADEIIELGEAGKILVAKIIKGGFPDSTSYMFLNYSKVYKNVTGNSTHWNGYYLDSSQLQLGIQNTYNEYSKVLSQ